MARITCIESRGKPVPVSVRLDTRDLTRTPMAKLMFKLEKGMRMVIKGLVAAQG